MVFSIRSFQANDPQDGREWGVWFCLLSDSNSQKLFNDISALIEKKRLF